MKEFIDKLNELFEQDNEKIYSWFESFQEEVLDAFEYTDLTYDEEIEQAYATLKFNYKYENNIS